MFARKYQIWLQNCIAIILLCSMLLSSVRPAFAQDLTPEPEVTPTEESTQAPTETEQAPTEEATDEPTMAPTEDITEVPTEVVTEVPTDVPTEAVTPEPEDTETPAVDVTPPTGTITAPVAGTGNQIPLTIRVDASDTESGVAKVEFYVSTAISAVEWSLIGTDETAPYEFAWDWSAYQDGEVLLSATVFDVAGNSAVVSNPVQVTLTHPIGMLEVPANDDMANAIEIVLGNDYSQDTTDSTLEVGEPLESCNLGSTGSVWYSFTSATEQIYTFSTTGTTYDHTLSIFKASDTSLAACSTEIVGETSNFPVSFILEAGVTYLVAISSINGSGGQLNLRVDSTTCPGDLCISALNNGKWIQKGIYVKVLDSENRSIAESGDSGNGYVVFDDIPEGDYQISTSSYGILSLEDNVHSPGYHTVRADELPRYEIDLKDKNGVSAKVDQIILSKGRNAFAETFYDFEPAGSGWFYASPGTYAMSLKSDAAKSVIVDETFTLDGAGGTIDLDMSTMDTEDYTVSLDEVVGEVFYEQQFHETYASVWVPLDGGGTVTVALPENYGFDPTLVIRNGQDRSNFAITGFHTFTGSNDITTTFGGDLTMEIGFNSPAYTEFNRNYRLGGTGYLSSFVHDEYGNYLMFTEKDWTEDPIDYEVRDTNNTVIPGSLFEGRTDVWAQYEFQIAEGAPTGIWRASATYDSGAWQGLVTRTRDFTVLEKLDIPNDTMVTATVIEMGYEYTQETTGNTLELGEPLAYCNDDSSGSVWYKFTPSASGIFTFNTDGTDYNHAVSIFKASDLSLATCVREPNEISEDQTPFAYYAEAGVEYLVAISSFNVVGGLLTFKAESVTCPVDALCVTVRNGSKWAEKWMEIKLLNDENNWAAGKWGADTGYFVFEDVPAGTYKMVAAGYGLLYFDDTVTVPGTYTVAGEELPRYEIDMRDKNGNPTDCNELALGIGNEYYGISSYWSDEIGRGWLYATPGTYNIQASSNVSQTMISQTGFELSPSGGTLSLNANAFDYEEYTFHLDDIPYDTNYLQNLPNTYYWGNWIHVGNGDTVTVVQPDQFVTKVQLAVNKDENGQQNRLVFEKWEYDHTFTGSNDEDLSFGGNLSVDVEFYNPVDNWYEGPYRLGGTGYLAGALTDEYGNRLVYTEKQYNSQAFAFSVKDASNVAVPGSYTNEWPDVWNKYQFPISASKAAGTWHATASMDTGTWQGVVTTIEDFEVLAPIPNDNLANARTVTLTNGVYTNTMDTRGATIETNEPERNCFGDPTGSVWYKFTPTTTGIYSINTIGTDYYHGIQIFKNDTAKTGLACTETDADPENPDGDPNWTPIAYQFTANQTYLIEVLDNNGGGSLTFQLKKETCPAGALCVSGNGDNKWAERFIQVQVLDASNNLVADMGGEGLGYTIVNQTLEGTTIKPGKYKVITSAWGFYVIHQNVTIPGLLYVDSDLSPRVEINFRDTAGNLAEPDETIIAYTSDVISSPHPYGDNDGYYLRMTPGSYNMQISDQESKTILSRGTIAVAGNSVLDFDARNLETEEYTFHLDDVNVDVIYQQDMPGANYWGNSVPVEDGDTVTVGMPEGFVFRPELGFNVDDWWYAFSLEKHTFTGSADLTATLGGSLSPVIEYLDPPFRPGDEVGKVWIRANDAHDFFMVYAGHDVDGNWENVISSYEVIEVSTGDSLDDSSDDQLPELYARYSFSIPETTENGDLKVVGTLDTGPLQGPLTAEAIVPVYTADPNANDEITNAEVIAGLPYNVTDYDITGSTTSADDPTLDECGVGQGMASVWYQYFPTQSGIISVDTIGSDFDTVLAVWEYTPGGLKLVGCSDDIDLGVDQDSQLEAAVRSGTTYYIEAMEYNDPVGMSSLSQKPISIQQLGGKLSLNITQGDFCYELATGLNLKNSGTITVDPAPNCLGDLYLDGTPITSLRVTPKTGYTFQYWQIGTGPDTTTDNPITGIVMDQDRGYKAQLLIKPGLPVLASPATGALVANYTPTLDWSDSVPPADHYLVQIATNAAFTQNLATFPDLINSAYTVETALTPNTTYYWRVKAYGLDNGAESAWTAARTFRTKLAVPLLSKPEIAENVKTTRPTFQWNVVAGTNNYTLQISKNTNFATPVLTYTVTGTSYTPAVDLTPVNTTLYWRVKANGTNAGDYSAAWSFTSANPPGVPSLTAPATNLLVDGNNVPELQWNPSGTAPVDHYDLQVSRNNTFTDLVVDTTDTDTAYKPDPLASNTTYSWRVRSVAADGDYSLWSAVRTFRTRMDTPILNVPVNTIAVDTTRPVFGWNPVTGATGYTLQISPNNTFAAPVQTIAVKGISYTPIADILPKNALIYWRVMANGANPSFYTVPFSFTSANPPVVPVQVGPLTGALENTYTPTLTWKVGTGSLVPAATYTLEIAKNSAFTDGWQEVTGIPGTSYTFTVPLEPDKTYFWRVRSVAADGDLSLWSTSRTIRTRMEPPILTAPIVGTGYETHTNRPTFQWQAVEKATSYTLTVATNEALTTGLKTFTTSYTSFTPSVDLAKGATLYWAVKANGANPSLNSAAESFTTGTPPAIPVLVSPASGAVLTDTTPTVTWKAGAVLLPAATEYELQIASNAAFTTDTANFMTGTPVVSYTLPDLTPGKNWFWRVRSYNGVDFSGWSAARSFKEKINAPTLLSPANAAIVNDYTPTLDWSEVPGAVNYTLQVSRNSTFTSLLKNMPVPGHEYTFEADLLPNQTLYWRVKANGAAFASAWSPAYRFNTGKQP